MEGCVIFLFILGNVLVPLFIFLILVLVLFSYFENAFSSGKLTDAIGQPRNDWRGSAPVVSDRITGTRPIVATLLKLQHCSKVWGGAQQFPVPMLSEMAKQQKRSK
eukprot:g5763.t1